VIVAYDPHPKKSVLTTEEVMVMLSMRKTSFYEFVAHTPSFPKPRVMGQTRKGKPILRYPKEKVLAFLETREAAAQ
jgi:predicted DNA-binding transcriptional regulator AlpA